ncbi:MAG TPA: ABC transporter ATP-binding protein [Actinopolymorphaceae bacterium]|jgi:zinc transport system ATP-binding protein|nr:ABC transporter ATP-binding protein [Actinopolymorphaceae bacterium]
MTPVAATRASVVRLRGGSVSYAGQQAVSAVDLDVAPGEVVAVLGPNGSGKSTLMRAILGLVPLAAGSLDLFGVPAERFRDRARIGYVPQRHTVGGGVPATVQEVVSSGRLSRRRLFGPWLASTDRGIVADAIATVGLAEKAHEQVVRLSGGQQRRTLIARALASQPDLLVMDEPFAGVDLPNQEILATTLHALVRGGVTLLLVTHEIMPVASLVRRTLVLDHGRVAYDGPPTSPVLQRFGGPDPDPHAAQPEPRPGPFGIG